MTSRISRQWFMALRERASAEQRRQQERVEQAFEQVCQAALKASRPAISEALEADPLANFWMVDVCVPVTSTVIQMEDLSDVVRRVMCSDLSEVLSDYVSELSMKP